MGNSSGILAGKAYVEIDADKDPLTRKLKAAKREVQEFGAGLMSQGQNMFVAASAVKASILYSSKLYADSGFELGQMSKRTGIAVGALSTLGFAARQSGVSMDTLEGGVRKMQKFINEAVQGPGEARDTINDLRISIGDLANQTPDEQLKTFADKISKIENASYKAALAMKIFGKTGTELIPLLNVGGTGIATQQARARELGFEASPESVRMAGELKLKLDELEAATKGVSKTIGAVFAPEVIELTDKLTDGAIAAKKFIKEHKDLVAVASEATAALAVTAAGVWALGVAVKATTLDSAAFKVGIAAVTSSIAGIGRGIGVVAGALMTGLAAVTVEGVALAAAIALVAYGIYKLGDYAINGASQIETLKTNVTGLTKALNEAAEARARFANSGSDSSKQEVAIDDENRALDEAKRLITNRAIRGHSRDAWNKYLKDGTITNSYVSAKDARDLIVGFGLDESIVTKGVKGDMVNGVWLKDVIAAFDKRRKDNIPRMQAAIDARGKSKLMGGMDEEEYKKASKALDDEMSLANTRAIEDPKTREIATIRLQAYMKKDKPGLGPGIKNKIDEEARRAIEEVEARYKKTDAAELQQLKNAGIEDAQARELADTNTHYDTLKAAADKYGADTTSIEARRQQAIQNIRQKYVRQYDAELAGLRIAGMENSYERELNAAADHYDRLIKAAKDNKESTVELERIKAQAITNIVTKAARDLEDQTAHLTNAAIVDPFDRAIAEIKQKWKEAMRGMAPGDFRRPAMEKAQQLEIDAVNKSRQQAVQVLKDQITDLQIDLKYRHAPQAGPGGRDAAHRAEAERRELRDAAKNGFDPADIREKYRLMNLLAVPSRIETRGIFNPAALQSLQGSGGGSAAERTAKATEKIASEQPKALKKIADNIVTYSGVAVT